MAFGALERGSVMFLQVLSPSGLCRKLAITEMAGQGSCATLFVVSCECTWTFCGERAGFALKHDVDDWTLFRRLWMILFVKA